MVSTDPDRSIRDFEEHQPEILALAFDSLEKGERYLHDLYRLGTWSHKLPHQTLILCHEDDAQRVRAPSFWGAGPSN